MKQGARLLIFALFFSGLALAQSGISIDDDVVVSRRVDAFTDEVKVTLLIGPVDDPVVSLQSAPSRYMAVSCESGLFSHLVFGFSEYLNNGDFGSLEYRVDGGETTTISVFQDDRLVLLSKESGSRVVKAIAAIMTGNTVAVRATAYDGDRDQAVFEPSNLRRVMGSEGCTY